MSPFELSLEARALNSTGGLETTARSARAIDGRSVRAARAQLPRCTYSPPESGGEENEETDERCRARARAAGHDAARGARRSSSALEGARGSKWGERSPLRAWGDGVRLLRMRRIRVLHEWTCHVRPARIRLRRVAFAWRRQSLSLLARECAGTVISRSRPSSRNLRPGPHVGPETKSGSRSEGTSSPRATDNGGSAASSPTGRSDITQTGTCTWATAGGMGAVRALVDAGDRLRRGSVRRGGRTRRRRRWCIGRRLLARPVPGPIPGPLQLGLHVERDRGRRRLAAEGERPRPEPGLAGGSVAVDGRGLRRRASRCIGRRARGSNVVTGCKWLEWRWTWRAVTGPLPVPRPDPVESRWVTGFGGGRGGCFRRNPSRETRASTTSALRIENRIDIANSLRDTAGPFQKAERPRPRCRWTLSATLRPSRAGSPDPPRQQGRRPRVRPAGRLQASPAGRGRRLRGSEPLPRR